MLFFPTYKQGKDIHSLTITSPKKELINELNCINSDLKRYLYTLENLLRIGKRLRLYSSTIRPGNNCKHFGLW